MTVTFLTNKDNEELRKLINGNVGQDGFSPTITIAETENGHSLSVTDANGTESFNVLDGADGASVTILNVAESTEDGGENIVEFSGGKSVTIKNGSKGEDGYTPQRGVDFWTDEDKEEINSQTATFISEELAKRGQLKPEFANSIEECTDTSKLYVLPDGYVYAYMTKTEYTEAPNLFDREAVSLNYRYSGTNLVQKNGYYTTDFIPIDMTLSDPVVLRFAGGTLWTTNGTGDKLMLFDANKNVLTTTYIYSDSTSSSSFVHQAYQDGNDWCIDLGYVRTSGELAKYTDYDNISYIRINQCMNSSSTAIDLDGVPDVTVTIDAMGGVKTETGWMNTGHAFVPADYEDRIITLEDDMLKIKSDAGNSTIVPDYWEDAVNTAISSVKDKQALGGSQCISFALCSDMHVYNADSNLTKYLGYISDAVMKACDIPLFLNCGDFLTNDSLAEESYIPPCYDRGWGYLEPIPKEKILLMQGNHDGAYGAYTSTDTSTAYKKNMPPNTLWQYLFRPQSTDLRRVWGDNGKYFYVDNIPQKTRFICLNSHDTTYEENTDGTAKWNTMSGGYSQAQLDWLSNVALNVETGWSIVLSSHVPPTSKLPTDYNASGLHDLVRGIVTAYANKTSYTGTFTHDEVKSVDADFTSAKGEILGWFCGHCHSDNIVTDDLPFPIVTITCAGNYSYDNTEETRVLGSDNETAVDFVTVDKLNRQIYCTRLGVGSDRSSTY